MLEVGISRRLPLLLCAIALIAPATMAARPYPQSQSSSQAPKAKQAAKAESADSEDQDAPEAQTEGDEEEMGPAAVEIDVSKASPLIQELYRATRETKDKAILARLETAKSLVATTDVNATDAQGRTALHWTVFGSSYNTNTEDHRRLRGDRQRPDHCEVSTSTRKTSTTTLLWTTCCTPEFRNADLVD